MSGLQDTEDLLTFGGHLDVLRKVLFRVISIIVLLAGLIFCFKTETFAILLAPHRSDFCTFRLIEKILHSLGFLFRFNEYDIPLINTELSAQFMTHITVSARWQSCWHLHISCMSYSGSYRRPSMRARGDTHS